MRRPWRWGSSGRQPASGTCAETAQGRALDDTHAAGGTLMITPMPPSSRAPELPGGEKAGRPLSESSSGARDPVELLVDEFLQRRRRGERPTVEEYAARH